jgi:NAD(P)-dependent dehydrogenase (short-subunit alcohol dehydrogenase family)
MAGNEARLMTGKTVLVTGGTSGIGKATAAGCAALGARVGIVGRDRARAAAALADIRAASAGGAADVFVADMASQAEVRRLAAEVLAAYPRLDVLVNNVGGIWPARRVTADGLEQTFAVNHLAPFLLTALLLGRLKESAPARIVTVASHVESSGTIDFGDLQGASRYSAARAYSQSKLANVMFSYELARRIEGTGVTATVLHPGIVHTNFGAEGQSLLFRLAHLVSRPIMKTAAQGAATPVYLASSPEVEGVTGAYFADCKPKKASRQSQDSAAAARLWQVSEELTGLGSAVEP